VRECEHARVRVCVCVQVHVRACVRACMRACAYFRMSGASTEHTAECSSRGISKVPYLLLLLLLGKHTLRVLRAVLRCASL